MIKTCGECAELNKDLMWCEKTKKHVTLDMPACKKKKNEIKKISFVGLGKLGCGMFACLASEGHQMLGIDTNEDVVEKIRNCVAPYDEPFLEDLLNNYRQNMKMTTGYGGIKDTDITFVMLPTPSDADGRFSNKYLKDAVKKIGENIPHNKPYHLVVICSTVIPGTMHEVIKPILQKATKWSVGEDNPIGLCYNPEFMALGRVIENYRTPSFRIIGESDKKAGDCLEEIYRGFRDGSEIYRMSLYNAELAKIANNAFVLTKISFANTIAEICEKMPTGDARVVLDAVGADKRIGKHAFKPGLGYSGTCFPRDVKAFSYATSKYHSQAFIPEAAEVVNMRWIRMNADVLKNILMENDEKQIAILGLTYNPGISSMEESASLLMALELHKSGIKIEAYDPSFKNAIPSFREAPFNIYKNAKECISGKKVCFIATPWDEFKHMKKEDFTSVMKKKPIIIDAYGCNNNLENDSDIDYRRMGTYQLRGNP